LRRTAIARARRHASGATSAVAGATLGPLGRWRRRLLRLQLLRLLRLQLCCLVLLGLVCVGDIHLHR
jgi:hypothetical protein